MSSLRLALKQSLAETAAIQDAEKKKREEEEQRRRKDKRRRQRARQEQQRRRDDERRRRRRMQQLRRAQQESLSGMNVGSGGRSVSSSTLSSSGSSSSSSGSSSSGGSSSSSGSDTNSDSDGSSSSDSSRGRSSGGRRSGGRNDRRYSDRRHGDTSSGSDDDDGSSSEDASVSSSSASSSSSSESEEDEIEMEGVFDSEVSSDGEDDDTEKRAAKKKKQQEQQRRRGDRGLTDYDRRYPPDRGPDERRKKKKKKKASSSGDAKGKGGGSKGSGGGGNKKSSSGAQQTTTPPAPEIVAWMKNLSIGKQRRNMAAGLRVKVRFVTKSNKRGKDGKPLRRLKWYGGLVTDVSTSGKKIRIKYDDGTSEVSDFPDKDIVVDDENNKRHKYGVSADAFLPPQSPPSPRGSDDGRDSPKPRARSRSRSPVALEAKLDKAEQQQQQEPPQRRSVASPSPERQQQRGAEIEMQTPTGQKVTADDKLHMRGETTPVQDVALTSQPSPGSVKPSAVSESPFSPAPNMLSSVSSKSAGEASEESGSFDGEARQRAKKLRKRVRSPVPQLPVPATVEHTDPAAAAEAAPTAEPERRTSGGADKPSTTLHIKLIPPKLKKTSSDGSKDKPKVHSPKPKALSPRPPPPPKLDDDAGYLPSDGEELEKTDDHGSTTLPSLTTLPSQESEFEWNEDSAGLVGKDPAGKKESKGPKLSGKKRTSPVLSDSENELPPRKRPVPIKKAIIGDSGDIHQDAGGDGRGAEQKPSNELASESTAFSTVATSTKTSPLPTEPTEGRQQETIGAESGPAASSSDTLRIRLSPRDAVRSEPPAENNAAQKSPRPPGKKKKKRSREERDRSKSPVPPSARREERERSKSPVPVPQEEQERPKSPLRNEIARSRSPRREDADGRAEMLPATRRGSNSSRGSATQSDALPQDDEQKELSETEAKARSADVRSASPAVPPEQPTVEGRSEGRPPEAKSTTKITIPVPRSGRRAAKKANERIKERKEIVIKDESAKSQLLKKKRPDPKHFPSLDVNEGDDADAAATGGGEEGEEDRWVQCDRCEKWRLLPSSVEMDKLPERWYCELNVYDERRNNCDAPEQTAKEIEAEKKLSKKAKKAKMARGGGGRSSSPEGSATESESGTGAQREVEPTKRSSPPRSDDVDNNEASAEARVVKVADPDPEFTAAVAKNSSPEIVDSDEAEMEDDRLSEDVAKEGKSSSGGSKKGKQSAEDVNSAAASDTASDIASMSRSKASSKEAARERKRERDRERRRRERERERGRDRDSGRDRSSKGSKEKSEADSQEWVQCEKCEKWRRLPPRISAEDLPEIWYCSMNTWDPNAASCDVEEDTIDSGHKEFTIFGAQTPNGIGCSVGSSGKLSYRNLIFGTGRKKHRPVSERTRAAESLFSVQPVDSSGEESGPPTVMYANSSAFMCRGFNSNRSAAEDEGRVSFLDIMSKSELWSELYAAAKAMQALSCGGAAAASSPDNTQGSIGARGDDSSVSMKGLVQRALGNKTLAGHEVLLEAQCRQWDDRRWSELRATCTIDNVARALDDLVKDGAVESVDGVRYRNVVSRMEKAAKVSSRSKHSKTSRCGKKKWLDRARSNVESARV